MKNPGLGHFAVDTYLTQAICAASGRSVLDVYAYFVSLASEMLACSIEKREAHGETHTINMRLVDHFPGTQIAFKLQVNSHQSGYNKPVREYVEAHCKVTSPAKVNRFYTPQFLNAMAESSLLGADYRPFEVKPFKPSIPVVFRKRLREIKSKL